MSGTSRTRFLYSVFAFPSRVLTLSLDIFRATSSRGSSSVCSQSYHSSVMILPKNLWKQATAGLQESMALDSAALEAKRQQQHEQRTAASGVCDNKSIRRTTFVSRGVHLLRDVVVSSVCSRKHVNPAQSSKSVFALCFQSTKKTAG